MEILLRKNITSSCFEGRILEFCGKELGQDVVKQVIKFFWFIEVGLRLEVAKEDWLFLKLLGKEACYVLQEMAQRLILEKTNL